MNEMLKRATQAVADVRRDGHHGFDDEIARAVVKALQEPTEELLEAPWFVGLAAVMREQWNAMIHEILHGAG